jgi:broad specificity phosphatase PhoE
MERCARGFRQAFRAVTPIAAIVLAAIGGLFAEQQVATTTVYLVRHAEKQAAPAGDPPLTEAGRARAAELLRIMGPLGIRTIITSQYLRTKETAGPLAAASGITPLVIPMAADRTAPGGIAPRSIKELVDRILEHKGESVLVVGHSNTLPLIIKGLGGAPVPDIPDAEYDNLFVVTISDKGEVALTKRKY